MSDHADIDATIVGKHVRRTIGTCRQYAEQSMAWKNDEGRSEDQHLQRIWNLADDSTTLIDFAHALVARANHAEARVTVLEAALRDLNEYAARMPGYSLHPLTERARAALADLAKEGT